MYVIKNIQARQGHPTPKRAGRSMGPFPSEIYQQAEVVNPYAPAPAEWLICSECGGRELEENIPFHVCFEGEGPDDADS